MGTPQEEMDRRFPPPSPQEIAQRAAQVRQQWDEDTRRWRAHDPGLSMGKYKTLRLLSVEAQEVPAIELASA